jgi:hypothetical protein
MVNMVKPNQAVRPIVARPNATSEEPASDKASCFTAVLELLGCTADRSTAIDRGVGEAGVRSTHPAEAGLAASAGISNFGLGLRRACGRPGDGPRGDPLVADMVLSAC